MIIEFLQPHSLNMGEDFEYISTFVKGKGKLTIDNCRLLVKGVKTGTELFLALDSRPGFFGKPQDYSLNTVRVTGWVTPDHAKGEKKIYNYYRLRYDVNDVHIFLSTWRKADPMVHMGGYIHQMVSKAGSNYKGSYKFDNKVY